MGTNVDLLEFTKQTETLLCGVGAQNLVKECKRRNISTNALHRLTKEDFVQLGADADHAENIVNALCISKKKQYDVKPKSHYRVLDKVEILQIGERQLSIIQDFVKYCKMKLNKERINFFIEADKALSASQILCISAEATLNEVSEAELKLKELEAMIMMMDGGAYGGGKAGAPFDPIAFVQRPQVILRALCLVSRHSLLRAGSFQGRFKSVIATTTLFAIIVFGCISSKGYLVKEDGKEVCLYNEDNNACNYGIGIGVLAFLASIGFLAGEYLFEQMSSVKTRKHFVLIDLGFSGLWSFLYFVGFCYLTNAWNNSVRPPNGYGVNNVQSAIAFSFFSIFTWAACAWFAFQRFKQGTDAAFAPSYEADPVGGTGYTSYPDATDTAYQEPPFGQQQQRGMGDFQAPAY
ncbi:Synaptogyrin-2 [Trachymyrmex zeteki]|uniref:Synaptogyrin-2 n=1 Tax=Mycetomoellerius zeteki TaxID=64791 RepID=A0A151X6V0_9HYME|nr:PREDICTED: synaptogyrin-2 [Trachymyrmex zeteki]KYQ56082.1 Synaptogyrin-2 [Trachymyrmex zeteki]